MCFIIWINIAYNWFNITLFCYETIIVRFCIMLFFSKNINISHAIFLKHRLLVINIWLDHIIIWFDIIYDWFNALSFCSESVNVRFNMILFWSENIVVSHNDLLNHLWCVYLKLFSSYIASWFKLTMMTWWHDDIMMI